MERLDCLQALVQIADAMQLAADARDGEQLDALAATYHTLSAQLQAMPLARADDPDAARVAELAERIVARQAQLEASLQPWMSDLRLIFREQRNERALASAYRSGS